MPYKDPEARKEYHRVYAAKRYKENNVAEKARLRKSNQARREKMKIWWKEYKSTLSCAQCTEDHPSCMTFHHLDPKEKEIDLSQVIRQGWSKERILKEVAKCSVLCENCHRKLHWELRNS